jgi:hypothetical protein
LSYAQVNAGLSLFGTAAQGVVPASGGGTANFLRADGTWAAPGGGAGLPLIGTGATVTTSQPLLDLSQTWNAGAVVFTAIRSNMTSTASSIDSKLIDLQIGGTTRMFVDRADYGLAVNSAAGNAFTFGDVAGVGTTISVNGGDFPAFLLQDNIGNNGPALLTQGLNGGTAGFRAGSNQSYQFSSNAGPTGAPDILLFRDAAATLAQRNSTNAQTFRVYNTFTDASNYERGVLDWTTTANTLTIGTQQAGTGVARTLNINTSQVPLYIMVAGTKALAFDNTGTGSLYFPNGGNISWSAIADPYGPSRASLRSSGALVLANIAGTFSFGSSSPTTLASGSTNNYDPTSTLNNSNFLRITANAANSTLTGFSPYTSIGQLDGQMHIIVNIAAAGTLTLSHQDAGSTATNRFLCSTGANIVLSPNQAADVIYDNTAGRWLVFKRN